ncbi:PadR family transcriptional regulator [Patescibacteria group bacterium]|nr:PadR family transcriptional regulator [Patescibacteria group bacterium]MCL5797312.1 PadR family transcriptional regulator [Patescibacteria group bacterium]
MSKNKTFANPNVSLTPQIFYILLSLATKDRHGYDIMKQVAIDSQNKIRLGPGTLYGAIKRMLEEKLITAVRSDDKRRKYYRLTGKGRTIFSGELNRYNNAVILARNRRLFSGFSTVLLNPIYE